MAKKPTKAQRDPAQNIDNKDISYLRLITRKILHSVEGAVELFNSGKYAELEELEKTHNLLFGSKASLAGTLVTLADLMLKLNQVESSEDDKIFEERQAHSLSEYDIALVEIFVQKLKNDANPQTFINHS